jgi:hypothetical protein
MTTDTQRLKDAFRETGLALLGFTFEKAVAVPMIRVALECKVKAQAKGKPAPIQPALI